MKKSLVIFEIFLIVLMFTSTVLAFENAITQVDSNTITGHVNISLEEYEQSDRGEILYTGNNIVLPGDEISLIPRITNYGIDCYVRARINYSAKDGTKINIDDVTSMGENWIKKDDYYYYTQPLGSGEKVDIFHSVSIPTNITNNDTDQQLFLNIIIEAVQEKNFTVDFTDNEPWEYVTIKECTDKDYDISKVESLANVTVKYDSDAGTSINISESFFKNLTELIPGSSVEEIVNIKNDTVTDMNYYFTTSINNNLIEALKAYNLRIIDFDDNTIYDGSLYCQQNCNLGTYKPGENKKLRFIISMDSELNNSYSINNGNLNWQFTTQTNDSKTDVVNPQTADPFLLYAITFIISFMLLILTIILMKNGGKNE